MEAQEDREQTPPSVIS